MYFVTDFFHLKNEKKLSFRKSICQTSKWISKNWVELDCKILINSFLDEYYINVCLIFYDIIWNGTYKIQFWNILDINNWILALYGGGRLKIKG